MIFILTFFCKFLQSLLNLFTLGCARSPTPADIEEGVLDEKNDSASLHFDPTIDTPVIRPIVENDSFGSFIEVSLADDDDDANVNGGDTNKNEFPGRAQSITSPPKYASPKAPPPDAPSAAKKPAHARLLDILIQFPLPPPPDRDDNGAPSATGQANQKTYIPGGLFRKFTWPKQRIPPVPPLPRALTNSPPTTFPPLTPTSTRRSSLVWFADSKVSPHPTSKNASKPSYFNPWSALHRTGVYDQSLNDFTSNRAGDEWTDGRGSGDGDGGGGDTAMTSILQGLEEVDRNFMQGDMSVRDLFSANMSLYTAEGDHSFSSTTSSCEEGELGDAEGEGEGDGNTTATTTSTAASFMAAEFVFPMVGRERGQVQGSASDDESSGGANMLLWDVKSSIDSTRGSFHRRTLN
ncbi:hypothetical protein EST38_g4428 [Candolleomyces aberdarensis]|uniref:Uncharacterized protein n=1 Tax=Candolleomyces aberdarensis TaxID=2316362 RepID=A0A4V1Q4A6_9AGAR|nr:hypothetical protein EST38_g4428 [Candolleomyces aberdarensis]